MKNVTEKGNGLKRSKWRESAEKDNRRQRVATEIIADLLFYSRHQDLEGDSPVFHRLIDLGALLYFSLPHHYVPNTAESEHSSF